VLLKKCPCSSCGLWGRNPSVLLIHSRASEMYSIIQTNSGEN
jgi:hypothetical protein